MANAAASSGAGGDARFDAERFWRAGFNDGRTADRPDGFSTVPRRSVYGFVNRDIVSNFASTFDGANPNACTAKRPDTTVPQQTLFALNSEFIQDRAPS